MRLPKKTGGALCAFAGPSAGSQPLTPIPAAGLVKDLKLIGTNATPKSEQKEGGLPAPGAEPSSG